MLPQSDRHGGASVMLLYAPIAATSSFFDAISITVFWSTMESLFDFVQNVPMGAMNELCVRSFLESRSAAASVSLTFAMGASRVSQTMSLRHSSNITFCKTLYMTERIPFGRCGITSRECRSTILRRASVPPWLPAAT